MNFLGIIPARYASTRFPGKPLAIINGKTMISRVYEQANKASSLSKVVVATDDERIKKHIEDIGGIAILTSTKHKSGTDRCYEAADKLQSLNNTTYDVIINIQGDEPFINPAQIDILCNCFTPPVPHLGDIGGTQIATLIKKITVSNELFNPNIVKVVTDKNNKAIYFSRSPIPYLRGKDCKEWLNHHTYFKHIGIYAYTIKCLERLTKLEISPLEKSESLEQLRWLENGFPVKTQITDYESFAIDTPEDLLTINQQSSIQ